MIENNENIDSKFNEIASLILKEKRLEKNYSLEEVVNKMNNTITRQALFKYENNEARMKVKIFKELCRVLALDPDEVIEEVAKRVYTNNYIIKSDNVIQDEDFITKTTERPSTKFLREAEEIFSHPLNSGLPNQNTIQNKKLIDLIQRTEENKNLKVVFDKIGDLDDKELGKLEKLLDVISDDE